MAIVPCGQRAEDCADTMKERIQKLAEESGIMHTSMSDAEWIKQGRLVEKFAELIVQECMNVLDPGEHQLIARFQARKWLAEHFGVEE